MSEEKILITRPNHDLSTHYLYYYSKEIKEEAEEKGLTVFDLKGNKANRKKLESGGSKFGSWSNSFQRTRILRQNRRT